MSLKVGTKNNSVRILSTSNKTEATIYNSSITQNRHYIKTQPTNNSGESRFKLIVVKKINEKNEEFDAQLYLQNSGFANSSRNTSRYPSLPYLENIAIYGVFIDPDLYPNDPPIYVFQCPDERIKCFITNHGKGKDYWSAHIIHTTSIRKDKYNLDLYFWRIVTIDKDSDDNITGEYILDSALDLCGLTLKENEPIPEFETGIEFSRAYDISNITFAGGGLFTGYGLDFLNDAEPTYGSILFEVSKNYLDFSGYNLRLPNGNRYTEIYRSLAPKSFFSWIRGNLTLSTDVRKDYSYVKNEEIKDHISTNFKSNYSFNLTIRPSNYMGLQEAVVHTEYCNSTATIIENTNYRIDSIRRRYDYGTYYSLKVFQEYKQSSNCIRGFGNNSIYNQNKRTIQPYLNFPFLSSDNYAKNIVYLASEGQGSIRHNSIIARDSGYRGVSYGWHYRFWHTFGKVLSVEFPPDQKITIVSAIQGNPKRDALKFLAGIGTPPFYKILENKPNVIELLWDTPPNPPTIFAWAEGTISFNYEYIKPPFFQHNGLYYYEDNPEILNDATNQGELVVGGDVISSQLLSVVGTTNFYNDPRKNRAGMNHIFNEFHGGWWIASQSESLLDPNATNIPRGAPLT